MTLTKKISPDRSRIKSLNRWTILVDPSRILKVPDPELKSSQFIPKDPHLDYIRNYKGSPKVRFKLSVTRPHLRSEITPGISSLSARVTFDEWVV